MTVTTVQRVESAPPASLDAKELRRALGGFATGVCVLTACTADGKPVGMTANSFSSVSLDPPLVLWSIARTAPSFPVFTTTSRWTMNVLAEDQEEISNRFATPVPDKFAGIEWEPGPGGVPRLAGVVTRFECTTEHRYDGGDHVILVGRVEAFERFDRAPLLFANGRYGRLTAD